MTSWNGNIFRVIGPFCGEFTGHWWIPLTEASGAEHWYYLWSAPCINGWVNNGPAIDLRRHYSPYDVTVMWIHGCSISFHWIAEIFLRMLDKRGVLMLVSTELQTVYTELITTAREPNCFLNCVKNAWHCGKLTTWWIVAWGYYDNAWLSRVVFSANVSVRPLEVDGNY